jgi:hypothetical protein
MLFQPTDLSVILFSIALFPSQMAGKLYTFIPKIYAVKTLGNA